MLSGKVFVRELLLQGLGAGKVTLLRGAARRCFFEAGGGELARGGGEGGWAWVLMDAAKNSGLGTCLAHASAQLQVWSSAGKPSAGGGALPKKGQGRKRMAGCLQCLLYALNKTKDKLAIGSHFLSLTLGNLDTGPTYDPRRTPRGRCYSCMLQVHVLLNPIYLELCFTHPVQTLPIGVYQGLNTPLSWIEVKAGTQVQLNVS
ncbi:hypothetical protein B0H14DRAFT_3737423 [Mycena olivaceomarginata]|nr:hypothetical protein B0H14DRAFT_3737423 [Mycena olivaceomarginata]